MVSGTAAAILAYGGASGMLQMMHSSDSSSSEALAALMSPRSGPGHHSSAGGNVAAGREEAVAGQQTGSPTASAGNLKRAFFPAMFEASEETGEDDDMGQPTEKKRRLSVEQVRSLEKNFEVENKLEPERKMQLARDLGLQPRQVAVWFQNRRARWKTKQLEKDYEVLKADFDALKGDYTALAEEKDKLVAEVKRLNAAITSPTAVEPVLSEVSNASSSEGLKKPEKPVSEHLSDPPAIPLKAVAPTDATSVATTKAMPALPQAPLTKPVLIPPELLAIPIPSSKDLDTKDYQLSPTSVSNFPGGNSNLRESTRTDSGIYGAGGGSPHHSGNSSDTNSVSSVSDMCNVDSPHHSPIDSSYSGKFLPMLLQQQQLVQKSTATSSEFSGEGSMSTWPSTTASAGFDDSCCSSLSSLNVDLSFPTPGTPAQTCMLANLNIESPFCDLVADDFCNQRLLNSPPGFGAPRVKIEEGGVMALHSDELSSHVFNMDDQSLALPWWDWP